MQSAVFIGECLLDHPTPTPLVRLLQLNTFLSIRIPLCVSCREQTRIMTFSTRMSHTHTHNVFLSKQLLKVCTTVVEEKKIAHINQSHNTHTHTHRETLIKPGRRGRRGGHRRRRHEEETRGGQGQRTVVVVVSVINKSTKRTSKYIYMEKFRHFGDAATGIHPFTTATAAAAAPTVSRISAACAFPPRLLLSAVFVLLLFVTDTLLWVCHVTHLGLLGRFLFAPLQRACLRGLLFAIGHILPEKSTPAVKPQKGGEVESSSRAVRAGDLVVCNLQSVWDALVFEVMLAQPYHAVCFPDATTAVDIDATSPRKNATVPGLRVFWPGPMQRWRVWAHTRRTGTLAFLAAQHPDSIAQQAIRSKTETAELPLHRVQEAAARAGVPVWWFGEGTCSNGRGLLLMPAVTCMSAAASDASAGCLVHLATIQYVSPALQNVLGSDLEGLLMVLFRTGPPLHGSMAPAWTSPLLPTAEVTFRSARLARAAPLAVVGSKSSSMKSLWTLSTPALLELRHIMCQRGQALVMSSSAASVRRQPLSVGLKEKKGFIEAYHAMLDSHKAQQSA